MVDARNREPDLLTVAQVAERLGIGRTKFYELMHLGELPFRRIRLGDRWRFSRLEVERYCHGDLASSEPSREAA